MSENKDKQFKTCQYCQEKVYTLCAKNACEKCHRIDMCHPEVKHE